MPQFLTRMALTGAALLVAAAALAQTNQQVTLTPERPARWDVAGGAGFLAKHNPGDPGDPYGPYDWWDRRGEIRFDLGRYLTTHLKAEIGVSLPQSWTDTQCGPRIPVAGLRFGYACTSLDLDRRLTNLAPGFTYQFRENAFAHPYVSAGVQIGVQETHTHNNAPLLGTLNGIRYTVPAIDHRTTKILAHPFVAGGFKSYFNDRAFLRSEGTVAIGSGGPDQMTLRLGFGLDF